MFRIDLQNTKAERAGCYCTVGDRERWDIGGGVIYLRGKTVYFYRIASVRDALANEHHGNMYRE